MQKRILTIGGRPGSGKSTVARMLAERLGYDRFSSGGFMREMAHERGITLDAVNTLAETDPSIDTEIDAKLKALGEKDKVIADSHLAFHWIPDSFKVFLDVSEDVAARRIFNDASDVRQRVGDQMASPEEAIARINNRIESQNRRWKGIYGVDSYDPSQYDLIISTDNSSPKKIVEEIIEKFEAKLNS